MSHFLQHHITHHHFHYNEMNELYISLSLRALAIGVGGIFVPLFLYDIGFSLPLIALFYVYAMGLRIPMEIVSAYLIRGLGIKHTLTVSYACLFMHFISLYLIPYYGWMWVVAGLFLALEMSFFWTSYHLQVSRVRSRDKASRQVGITIILRRVFMALGPLIGGLLASIHGVQYTLLLAAVCLSLAAYPLFKTPDLNDDYEFRLKMLRPWLLRKDGLAHLTWQVSGVVATMIWPLWLLLVLGDYSQIGIIVALSIILGIGLTFWVGHLGDRGLNQRLLKLGATIKMISHGARTVSFSFNLAFAANLLNDMGDNFAAGPFTEKFYEAADQGQRFMYVIQTHIINAAGKFLAWAIVLYLAVALSELAALQVMFLIAGLSVPFMVWVSNRS